MTKRFEETMISFMRGMDARLDAHDTGLSGLSTQFDRFEAMLAHKFDKVSARFDKISQQFDEVYGRFDKISQQFDEVYERFDTVTEQFGDVSQRLDHLDRVQQQIIAGVIPEIETRAKHELLLTSHERRIIALENAN